MVMTEALLFVWTFIPYSYIVIIQQHHVHSSQKFHHNESKVHRYGKITNTSLFIQNWVCKIATCNNVYTTMTWWFNQATLFNLYLKVVV